MPKQKPKTYIEEFKDVTDIIRNYRLKPGDLDKCKIFLAWYGYGDYSGSSWVIFEKQGKLYEVNASHCSCYGLENQWEPVETTFEALKIRRPGTDYSYTCEGKQEVAEEFKKLLVRLEKKYGARTTK